MSRQRVSPHGAARFLLRKLRGILSVMEKDVAAYVDQLSGKARSEAWRAFQGARHALDRQVLESAAFLGLVQAADRWPLYCAKNSFDPGCGKVPCERPETCGMRYFEAYATRRMRGAILDEMRKLDWVPRAVRQKAKLLTDNGQGTGATEAELVKRTSLSATEIRQVNAAVAQRPCSVDEGTFEPAARISTESQAAADGIMQAVVIASRALPIPSQVILAMRYYEGRELKDCAVALGLPEPEVSRLHADAVVAVHEAMLAAARG